MQTENPSSQDGARQTAAAGGAATLGMGAAITATLAGACCVGPIISPIIVGVLGVSGAAAIAGLKPLMPYFFGASALALGFAFWQAYRPSQACAPGVKPRGPSLRAIKAGLWFSALLWTASLAYTIYNVTHS